MKKLTRFCYRSMGSKYSSCLDGHMTHSQIQMALLAQRRGCQYIWGIKHDTVTL